jgi:Uma2 family endonuclease
MNTVISPNHAQLAPGTVVRMLGSWQDYCVLCESRGDSSIPRLKFRDGEILLMSPMPRHGRDANILADVVKAILDAEKRNYEAFTPITMQLPGKGGIEPDYCFYIDNWQAAVGRDRLNWEVDPPPDLVIEIDVTSYSDAKDYVLYGVPEVWLLKRNALAIYGLQGEEYQLQKYSRYFPMVNLQTLVEGCLSAASESGTGVALRELRARLQKPLNP